MVLQVNCFRKWAIRARSEGLRLFRGTCSSQLPGSRKKKPSSGAVTATLITAGAPSPGRLLAGRCLWAPESPFSSGRWFGGSGAERRVHMCLPQNSDIIPGSLLAARAGWGTLPKRGGEVFTPLLPKQGGFFTPLLPALPLFTPACSDRAQEELKARYT